jgi:hypothetical protein
LGKNGKAAAYRGQTFISLKWNVFMQQQKFILSTKAEDKSV